MHTCFFAVDPLIRFPKRTTNVSLLSAAPRLLSNGYRRFLRRMTLTTSTYCIVHVCQQPSIRHAMVLNYHTARFNNTLPAYFPFLLILTFTFFASLPLLSSVYFLLLLSAFFPAFHTIFSSLCLSLFTIYFNLLRFPLPTKIPETRLRNGRPGIGNPEEYIFLFSTNCRILWVPRLFP
jgi:hypothetical protein